jgi:hypothetical protein
MAGFMHHMEEGLYPAIRSATSLSGMLATNGTSTAILSASFVLIIGFLIRRR